MPALPTRGRHRAASRPVITTVTSAVRSRLSAATARTGAVAASSGLALALFAAPASALGGSSGGAPSSFDVVVPPSSVPATSPVVSAPDDVEWSFDVPKYRVKAEPKLIPVSRDSGASRSSGRALPAVITEKGVPADLAHYGNGNIPRSRLHGIGSGHQLWAPAADAFKKLLAAASADGVSIGITDSYRPYSAQVSVAQRKGIYGRGGLAAVPGTSDHGWGRSLDLRLDGVAQGWMRANAGRFGFHEDVAGEPWHWTYFPNGR